MSTPSRYITGTDTGVGKTQVSVALLHCLRSRGLRAVGMKPVASGCVMTANGWRNDDALALQAASDSCPDYTRVNPFALPDATAPSIAAKTAGVVIELPALVAAYRALQSQAEQVVVEGVGGWLAPFTDGLEQSDLVRALDLDVVLVVGLRLGCLNHARLSARAIRDDGCRLVGWVANAIEPMEFADDYFAALQAAMAAPCLGRIPFAATASAADRAKFLACAD